MLVWWKNGLNNIDIIGRVFVNNSCICIELFFLERYTKIGEYLYIKAPYPPIGGIKMIQRYDFDKRMQLIDQMAENIMKKGMVKDRQRAEQIARRWLRYN